MSLSIGDPSMFDKAAAANTANCNDQGNCDGTKATGANKDLGSLLVKTISKVLDVDVSNTRITKIIDTKTGREWTAEDLNLYPSAAPSPPNNRTNATSATNWSGGGVISALNGVAGQRFLLTRLGANASGHDSNASQRALQGVLPVWVAPYAAQGADSTRHHPGKGQPGNASASVSPSYQLLPRRDSAVRLGGTIVETRTQLHKNRTLARLQGYVPQHLGRSLYSHVDAIAPQGATWGKDTYHSSSLAASVEVNSNSGGRAFDAAILSGAERIFIVRQLQSDVLGGGCVVVFQVILPPMTSQSALLDVAATMQDTLVKSMADDASYETVYGGFIDAFVETVVNKTIETAKAENRTIPDLSAFLGTGSCSGGSGSGVSRASLLGLMSIDLTLQAFTAALYSARPTPSSNSTSGGDDGSGLHVSLIVGSWNTVPIVIGACLVAALIATVVALHRRNIKRRRLAAKVLADDVRARQPISRLGQVKTLRAARAPRRLPGRLSEESFSVVESRFDEQAAWMGDGKHIKYDPDDPTARWNRTRVYQAKRRHTSLPVAMDRQRGRGARLDRGSIVDRPFIEVFLQREGVGEVEFFASEPDILPVPASRNYKHRDRLFLGIDSASQEDSSTASSRSTTPPAPLEAAGATHVLGDPRSDRDSILTRASTADGGDDSRTPRRHSVAVVEQMEMLLRQGGFLGSLTSVPMNHPPGNFSDHLAARDQTNGATQLPQAGRPRPKLRTMIVDSVIYPPIRPRASIAPIPVVEDHAAGTGLALVQDDTGGNDSSESRSSRLPGATAPTRSPRQAQQRAPDDNPVTVVSGMNNARVSNVRLHAIGPSQPAVQPALFTPPSNANMPHRYTDADLQTTRPSVRKAVHSRLRPRVPGLGVIGVPSASSSATASAAVATAASAPLALGRAPQYSSAFARDTAASSEPGEDAPADYIVDSSSPVNADNNAAHDDLVSSSHEETYAGGNDGTGVKRAQASVPTYFTPRTDAQPASVASPVGRYLLSKLLHMPSTGAASPSPAAPRLSVFQKPVAGLGVVPAQQTQQQQQPQQVHRPLRALSGPPTSPSANSNPGAGAGGRVDIRLGAAAAAIVPAMRHARLSVLVPSLKGNRYGSAELPSVPVQSSLSASAERVQMVEDVAVHSSLPAFVTATAAVENAESSAIQRSPARRSYVAIGVRSRNSASLSPTPRVTTMRGSIRNAAIQFTLASPSSTFEHQPRSTSTTVPPPMLNLTPVPVTSRPARLKLRRSMPATTASMMLGSASAEQPTVSEASSSDGLGSSKPVVAEWMLGFTPSCPVQQLGTALTYNKFRPHLARVAAH